MTVPRLRRMKSKGERITMVTAYDATFARLLDEAGVDVLLVGDSLGMVIQGNDSTLPVTVDEVIYHCRAVARGTRRAHVVGDMPFMSWQVSPQEALRNAGRFLSEGRAHAIKLEGGRNAAPTIRRIVQAGIPVMGHVGLTPQSVHAMGGFRVQGKTKRAAQAVLQDAQAVAEAGAYALVLEGIPSDLAQKITASIDIPCRTALRWPSFGLLRLARAHTHPSTEVREALCRVLRRGCGSRRALLRRSPLGGVSSRGARFRQREAGT